VATPVDSGLQLVVASGGHPLPVVVRGDGTTETLGHPGMIVGLLDEVAYRPASTVLVPGDTVVFYTDGATDLPPPGDLDPDQLADLVARAVVSTSTVEEAASVMADRLIRRVPLSEWKDDVALLLLRVTGTARTARPGT
jgi:serine phosphatase RsbU (regulator of sigma subunit)